MNAPDAITDPNSHALPNPVDGGTVLAAGELDPALVNPPYPAHWPTTKAQGLLVERQGYKDRGLGDRVAEVDAELAKIGVAVDDDGTVEYDAEVWAGVALEGQPVPGAPLFTTAEVEELLEQAHSKFTEAEARADTAEKALSDQNEYLAAMAAQGSPQGVEAPESGESAPSTEKATEAKARRGRKPAGA